MTSFFAVCQKKGGKTKEFIQINRFSRKEV